MCSATKSSLAARQVCVLMLAGTPVQMSWFDILCIGAAYGLLLLLAFAAPFVILLFVRASAILRIVMVMSAMALGSMALYGVALLEGLAPVLRARLAPHHLLPLFG